MSSEQIETLSLGMVEHGGVTVQVRQDVREGHAYPVLVDVDTEEADGPTDVRVYVDDYLVWPRPGDQPRVGTCFRCGLRVVERVEAVCLDSEERNDCPESEDGHPHEIDAPEGWDSP